MRMYFEAFNCFGNDYYSDCYDFGQAAENVAEAVQIFARYMPVEKATEFVNRAWNEGKAVMVVGNRMDLVCERATGRHLSTAGDWWRRCY